MGVFHAHFFSFLIFRIDLINLTQKFNILLQTTMNLFKNTFLVLFFIFSLNDLFAQTTNSDQSHPLFFIESISVEGNSKSKDHAVFNNLSMAVGDSLSEEQINQEIEHLRGLDLFKEISLKPRAGSKPGHLNLIIEVEERYWPIFRFKGGYSELDSWYLTPIGLHFDNIFGFGNFTNLDFTFGDRITSLKLNHINTNTFDSGFDLHFSIYVHNREFIHYVDGSKLLQKVPQGGYYLGLQSRQGFFKHFRFGLDFYATTADSFATYANEDKKFYDFPEHMSPYLKESVGTSSFSIAMNIDLRDQSAYPTRGWWLGMQFTQADKQLGGKTGFTRLVFDVRKYQKLFSNVIIAARAKAGVISSEAPYYEKFYLGGPNSLRGYADRSLSPLGGGEKLFQTGLELRFPISGKHFPNHFLSGVIFVDAGANVLQDEKIEQLKGSYGFGLRFRVPFLGLIRMDLGYPFEGQKMIQFSLGHTF